MTYCSYGGKVSSEEALLDAGPEGEGDDQDLVELGAVLEGGHEQLESGQLFLAFIPFVLAIPE